MRRSISRMSSRYALRRVRSAAPRSFERRRTSCVTQSRMLRSVRRFAARCSGVAPTPNSWSNADRGSQIARLAAGVVGLDLLNAALDFADVFEVRAETRTVGGAEVLREAADLLCHPVEDAAIGSPVRRALLRGGADAEQLVERGPRIPDRAARRWRCRPRPSECGARFRGCLRGTR